MAAAAVAAVVAAVVAAALTEVDAARLVAIRELEEGEEGLVGRRLLLHVLADLLDHRHELVLA